METISSLWFEGPRLPRAHTECYLTGCAQVLIYSMLSWCLAPSSISQWGSMLDRSRTICSRQRCTGPSGPLCSIINSAQQLTAVHKYFFIHLMYGIAVQLCNKCRSIALQASEQLTNSALADLPAPPPTTHSTQASQSTTRLVTTTTKASLRLLSNHFKIKKPLAWQYKTFPGHSLILEVSSIFFVSSSCTLAPILDFDPTQPLLSASWPKSHPSKIFVQSLVTKCHLCQPAESSVFCFEELLNCSSTDHKSNRTGSVVA